MDFSITRAIGRLLEMFRRPIGAQRLLRVLRPACFRPQPLKTQIVHEGATGTVAIFSQTIVRPEEYGIALESIDRLPRNAGYAAVQAAADPFAGQVFFPVNGYRELFASSPGVSWAHVCKVDAEVGKFLFGEPVTREATLLIHHS
jgi:hypothetical protein